MSFSREKIEMILKEHKAGATAEEICSRYRISGPEFFLWKSNSMSLNKSVSETSHQSGLLNENLRLKNLLADLMLEIAELKERTSKSSKSQAA